MNYFDILFAKKIAGGGSPLPPVIKRATGNPVEFSDAADAPVVKCVTQITGSQDLHGYDKPWVGGAGKNKLPLVIADIKTQNTVGTWSGNTYTYSTRTATLETYDGISVSAIHCKNTSTSGDSLLILDFTMPAGSYILSSGASETSGAIDTFVMKDGSVIARGNDQAPGPAFTLESDSLISFRVRINVVGEITFYPMIRLSTENDSTFSPYSNICPITAYTEGEIEVSDGDGNTTTHTTTYPSAIYRGSDDVVNGEVECIQKKLTISGNVQMIASFGDDNAPLFYVTVDSNDVAAYCINTDPIENKLISNVYTANTMNTAEGMKDFEMRTNYISSTNHNNIYWRDSRFTSATDMNTYIASNPIEVVYRVYPSPTTSSVTPTNLPIRTLSGYNHIESSTGEIVIDYITDQYQNFVDTVESALPNTRKGGTKALDIFLSLEPQKPEPEKEEDIKTNIQEER